VARKEPWLVTVDDIRMACEISDVCQNTDARTVNIMALTRNFVDPHHLFNGCPMAALIDRPQVAADNRAKFARVEDMQSKALAERKSQEKLPDRRAFWQMLKIAYMDTPASVVDYLRFALIKLLVLTGSCSARGVQAVLA
jgi:hypothetical protein